MKDRHPGADLLLSVISVVHPVLFAIVPVLFLYARNTGEVSGSQVVRPLLLSVLGTLALWLLLRPLMKNAVRTGVATWVCVAFYFSYGRIYDLLAGWDLSIARHSYLFPATLLALGYGVYFIRTVKLRWEKPARILGVVGAVLVSMNLLSALWQSGGAGPPDPLETAMAELDPDASGEAPDIYYIILDEFAHPDTMAQYYDYDSTWLTDELAEEGFYIAWGSRATYDYSHLAIASYLNMCRLPDGQPIDYYYQMIADSAVANTLREMGYTYVYYGSWYDAGRYRVDADIYCNFYESGGGGIVVNDFTRTLWNTTMARPFYDHFMSGTFTGLYRAAIIETLESIRTIPDRVEGPKFVFAHILCPHQPFVFGPNGEYVEPINWYNTRDRQYYLEQYMFIANSMASVISDVLRRSESEPIVILQSDHGLRAEISGGEGIGPEERWKVLNALYFPGGAGDCLYDSISPLNSFRLIFNRYFGSTYPMLEEPAA